MLRARRMPVTRPTLARLRGANGSDEAFQLGPTRVAWLRRIAVRATSLSDSLAEESRTSNGRRCRSRPHALPNLAIQLLLVRLIRPSQIPIGNTRAEGTR